MVQNPCAEGLGDDVSVASASGAEVDGDYITRADALLSPSVGRRANSGSGRPLVRIDARPLDLGVECVLTLAPPA